MSQTIEEKLAAAKKVAQDAEKKRIQFETKLEANQVKKAELLDKCKQLGVTPEELPHKITELEKKIQAGMQDLDKLLASGDAEQDQDLPY